VSGRSNLPLASSATVPLPVNFGCRGLRYSGTLEGVLGHVSLECMGLFTQLRDMCLLLGHQGEVMPYVGLVAAAGGNAPKLAHLPSCVQCTAVMAVTAGVREWQ
jgi:hypothetical protein